MTQTTSPSVLSKVTIDQIIDDLVTSKSKDEQVTWRLIEIREKGILWEINNPLGHNLFVVNVNFVDNNTRNSTIPPSIEKIKLDYSLMKKSSNKSITEVIPKNTSILFVNMNDATVYLERACGELLKSYKDINFLMHSKKI